MRGFAQVFLGIVIGIFLVGLIAGAYFLGKGSSKSNELKVDATPTSVVQPTLEPVQEITTGTIEGSISYPSEAIPDALEVCAQNTITQDVSCTKDRITDSKYDYGVGYQLALVPGSYIVYAHTSESDYKAYFSEAVGCGLSVNCTDHTPVVIKVMQGANLDNIDPQDWYDTSQN